MPLRSGQPDKGVALEAGAWLVLHLSLLSRADLSYVLPVTSSAYIMAAMLATIVLHDPIAAVRWLGIVLIAVGASLVGETMPRTDRPAKGTEQWDGLSCS